MVTYMTFSSSINFGSHLPSLSHLTEDSIKKEELAITSLPGISQVKTWFILSEIFLEIFIHIRDFETIYDASSSVIINIYKLIVSFP